MKFHISIPTITKCDIVFIALFGIDLLLRAFIASSHSFFDGDLLLPFSLIDIFHNNLSLDIGRQQWLLPAFIAGIMDILHTPNDFLQMLHISSVVTAITTSLVLIPTYLITRAFLSDLAGIWVTLLLMTNSMFSISSYYFNPTQTYALFITIVIAMIAFWDKFKSSPTYPLLLALVAGISYYIRHEGVILIGLTGIFFLYQYHKKNITKKGAILSVGILILFAALNWLIRIILTPTPLAFLDSTSATDKPFALLSYSWQQVLKLVHLNANYLLEKTVAIVANITIIGTILFPMGYVAYGKKIKGIHWFFAYAFLYLASTLIFMFVIPVADHRHYSTLHSFFTDPATRYFQVLTPLLLVLVYAGALHLISRNNSRNKKCSIIIHSLLILFMIHQITLSYYYYTKVFAIFGMETRELVQTAQYFRNNSITKANILFYNDDAPYLYFFVLSGRNTVNCWDGRPDPRYNCYKKYQKIPLHDVVQNAYEKFDYVILDGSAPIPGKLADSYEKVYHNSPFTIYKLISSL